VENGVTPTTANANLPTSVNPKATNNMIFTSFRYYLP
jgi:hypothetical protein